MEFFRCAIREIVGEEFAGDFKMSMSKFKEFFVFVWILMLTFLAGMLNIYSLEFFGMTVSHHTGNISNFALQLYEKGTANVSFFYVILSFFSGGIAAGYILHRQKRQFQESYGKILVFCGLVIIGLNYVQSYFFRLYSIVFILGFQNAIFIKLNNVLIRTSHFTGYLTDAGIIVGRMLRGDFKDAKNFIIYISSILGFIFGGLFCSYILDKCIKCLVLIGCFYIIAGIYYFIVRRAYFCEK